MRCEECGFAYTSVPPEAVAARLEAADPRFAAPADHPAARGPPTSGKTSRQRPAQQACAWHAPADPNSGQAKPAVSARHAAGPSLRHGATAGPIRPHWQCRAMP